MRVNEEGTYLGTKDSAILMWLYMILAIVFAATKETWIMWTMIGASWFASTTWFLPYIYRIRHIGQKQK